MGSFFRPDRVHLHNCDRGRVRPPPRSPALRHRRLRCLRGGVSAMTPVAG